MKITSAVSTLFTLLPAFTGAVPLTQRDTETTFGLIAIHSGNEDLQNQPITANANQFWVGRPTSTFCPAEVQQCPAGTQTALVGTIGGNVVSTSHLVPGEQSVYIAGPGAPTPGALQFNSAHASPPTGSITDRFLITETDLEYLDGNFYACPAMGAYYITTSGSDSAFCVGINLHIVPYTGPQPAAWQYV